MKGSGLKPLEDGEEVHVFGKNLEERVVTNDKDDEDPLNIEDNLSKDDDDIDSIRKRKFDAITGEEDEETIFQGEFKLFVWDIATSNWIEKGRGQLKLNDSIGREEKKSRLIMRVGGTLRIILNVAINRSFFRVIVNSKTNIRFTDSQTVWAASGSNANQLRDLIDERLKQGVEARKKTKPNETNLLETNSEDNNSGHTNSESTIQENKDLEKKNPEAENVEDTKSEETSRPSRVDEAP